MRLFIGTPAARLHPICWARLLWRGDFAPVSGLRSDDRVRPVRPCQASFLPDRIDGRARPPRVQPTSTAGSPAPGSASCRGVAPAYPNHPSAVCCRAGARGDDLEVHVSHAATAAAARHRRGGLLRLVRDDHFGRQEQRGDRRGILQRRAGDLGRVNDAGLDHVDVLAGGRIQAVPGLEGGVVVEKVRNLEAGHGLDAATGEYVDMVKAGIIDPAKVTRSALQNAASIAALFLTTEVVIADKPEKAAPAMPGGGGGGGMGDMDF